MAIPPELEGRVVVDVLTAAKLLKIGRNQVYAGVRDGSIPSLRIGGRILIPTRPLMRLLGFEDSAVVGPAHAAA